MDITNKLNIQITKDGRDYYNLSFIYNLDLITNIKKLEKKEYIAGLKSWKVDTYNLFQLILMYKGSNELFFNFIEEGEKEKFIIKKDKAVIKRNQAILEEEEINKSRLGIVELKNQLMSQDTIDLDYKKYLNEGIIPYNYQMVGSILSHTAKRLILGMDLGTGKSLTAILTAELYENDVKKVIIIVPNSLKYNWVNEIKKFTKQKYFIINANKGENIYTVDEAKYFIVNYDYFRNKSFNFKDKIHKFKIDSPDMFICDESHKLKNTKSNTTKNIKKYYKDAGGNKPILLLTGTPMPNRLEELFVQLNFVDPKQFSSKSKFYTEYCGMVYIPAQYGYVQLNEQQLDVVNKKLDPIMYRVKKKDVLKDLPEVSINKIYVDMTDEQQKVYKDIEDGILNLDWTNTNFTSSNEDGKKNSTMLSFLELTTKLRQYTSIVKLDTVKEIVTELNEENEKVIVFDTFINPLKQLTEYFKDNSEIYYGDIDASVRQGYVDKFQDKKSSLKNLFISYASGNFGITLTASCNMIALGQPFTPSQLEQGIGRVHRIGQEYPVTAWIIIVRNTIDEYMDNLIELKTSSIKKVIDNEEYEDTSNKSITSELMSLYKNKKK
jgi:SNF2 family DNA or RNA helicase